MLAKLVLSWALHIATLVPMNDMAVSLLALLAALLTSTAFAQEETTCATPRFLLHMSNSENGIADPASLLLNGTPLRVYEGEPFEWSHYAIAVLPPILYLLGPGRTTPRRRCPSGLAPRHSIKCIRPISFRTTSSLCAITPPTTG
jgi:hypothetical protein